MNNLFGASWRTGASGILSLLTALGAGASLIHNKDFDFGGGHWLAVYAAITSAWGLLFARDNKVSSEKAVAAGVPVDGMVKLGILMVASTLFLAGCQSTNVSRTSADGTKVTFSSLSLFSNTAVKGLNVDGTTKTTTNLLRITGGITEPNVESITATSDALGNIIGTAIATGAKGVKP